MSIPLYPLYPSWDMAPTKASASKTNELRFHGISTISPQRPKAHTFDAKGQTGGQRR